MNVVDQADGLRRLLGTRTSRIVALAGLSPGAGTTTAAMNLAVEVARQGRPVLVLDEQPPGPRSACALWSIAPRGTLADVAAGRVPLQAAAATSRCGVQVLPAPAATPHGSFNVRSLCPQGMIVIDAATDASGALSPLARLADEVVIVMQPSAASITATYAGLKQLQYAHALQTFHFVVNAAASAQQAQQVIANVLHTGSRYLAVSLRALGWVDADLLVRESARLLRTVCEAYPSSAAAAGWRHIAGAMLRDLPGATAAATT